MPYCCKLQMQVASLKAFAHRAARPTSLSCKVEEARNLHEATLGERMPYCCKLQMPVASLEAFAHRAARPTSLSCKVEEARNLHEEHSQGGVLHFCDLKHFPAQLCLVWVGGLSKVF